LTQELLAVNPQSPETWTAIGMYCEMKGKPDHALIYYDRVSRNRIWGKSRFMVLTFPY
jgi:hypothetical protein